MNRKVRRVIITRRTTVFHSITRLAVFSTKLLYAVAYVTSLATYVAKEKIPEPFWDHWLPGISQSIRKLVSRPFYNCKLTEVLGLGLFATAKHRRDIGFGPVVGHLLHPPKLKSIRD